MAMSRLASTLGLPALADLGEIFITGDDAEIEAAAVYPLLLGQMTESIRQATLSLSIIRKANLAAGSPKSFAEEAIEPSIDGPRVIIYEP
jgi:hypothetical protein